MNKAAQKRLLTAIDQGDVGGARLALQQGAEPGEAIHNVATPAFWLALQSPRQPNAPAILQLFLEHGLDPNLRHQGHYNQPLRIGMGMPLLHTLMLYERPAARFRRDRSTDVPAPDVLSVGDSMVLMLLEAGADPLAEETSEQRRNAWGVAAYSHRQQVIRALDRFVRPDWTPPSDREHPLVQVFAHRSDKWVDDGTAALLLQRFPQAWDHPFEGTSTVLRMQKQHWTQGVAWAVTHGAAPRGHWANKGAAVVPFDPRTDVAAQRESSVWPTVVRTALNNGLNDPWVQWALNDPTMRSVINRPLRVRDFSLYADDERTTTPLSYALHGEDTMPRHGDAELRRWHEVVQALVRAGATPDHLIDPAALTPGQRWAQARMVKAGALLDLYPAWEAPHPVSRRTPLFETSDAEGAAYWWARGHRLDHGDADGEQAFTRLVAHAVSHDQVALAEWCAQRLRQGHAPHDGQALGRSLSAWVGGRTDLLKAYEQQPGFTGQVGDQALHAAAEKLNLTALKALLAQPVIQAQVNRLDAHGLTPLMRLMLAPTTTFKQAIKRNEALAALVAAGARGDVVATVTFDIAPGLADKANAAQPARPGRLKTITGSALHLLALRILKGEEKMGALQRFEALAGMMKAPGTRDVPAWSTLCSDLTALVLLEASEDRDDRSNYQRLNPPPTLSTTWVALRMDHLAPTIVNDVMMAMLDPRRILSIEGDFGTFRQSLARCFTPEMFDTRFERLVQGGADPLAVGLDGRTPHEAMIEWTDGFHAATRESLFNTAPLPVVAVHPPYREHLTRKWKHWVDVAIEARALRASWQEVQDVIPLSAPVTLLRRRL